MKISFTGQFRTVPRTRTHWEVWYKHYLSGVMVLIADGLTPGLAKELRDNLNNQIVSPEPEPATPAR